MGQKTNVAQRILYDIRDGNSYRVRKLADGNCWMTENLRLEFDGNTTYDSSTTNLALGTTITPSATQARTAAPTAEEIAEWKIAGSVPTEVETDRWLSRGTYGLTESTKPYPQSGDQLTGENQYLGTYYNWYTASAGSVSASTTSVDATTSICPSGWTLPPRESDKSFDTLIKKVYKVITNQGYQDNVEDGNPNALITLRARPFSIPVSGYIWDTGSNAGGSAYNGGNNTAAVLWNSRAITDNKAGTLYTYWRADGGNVVLTTYGSDSRARGFLMRCVAV